MNCPNCKKSDFIPTKAWHNAKEKTHIDFVVKCDFCGELIDCKFVTRTACHSVAISSATESSWAEPRDLKVW
jgi:uncharacterized Zn finger protein